MKKNHPVYGCRYGNPYTGFLERIMRISLSQLFLIIAFTGLSYGFDSKAQELLQKAVSIQADKAQLRQVIHMIKKQASVKFIYSSAHIRAGRQVNLHVTNMKLSEVLEHLLTPLDLDYRIINGRIVLDNITPLPGSDQDNTNWSAPAPPDITLTGKVTDEKGEGLPGVNILIKGTRQGTVTDAGGNFTLHVPDEKAVLVFSFVGYVSREVVVGNRTSIDILLKVDEKSLEEVVVVGYGTVLKSDLTGAVSTIKGKDIAATPVARLDQALQGKAAGVYVTSINGQPGAGTTIRIRGGNSISASNEPLYVVDGFIGIGDLNSINAADIESIEILKDASATAIYGARGANGVILVTTKQGKEGKPFLSIDAYTGFQQLPREIALLSGPELASFVNERSVYLGGKPIFENPSAVSTTNWQKAITRSAAQSNFNLTFGGGNDKLTFYLSGNYYNQDGIIVNSGFKRLQTRLNLNYKPYSWLAIGTNINLSRSTMSNNKVNLYDVLKSAPVSSPVFDEDGNYTIVSSLTPVATFENPVALTRMAINDTHGNSLIGSWFAKASFKNGLTLNATLGINNIGSKNARNSPGNLPLRLAQKRGGYAYLDKGQRFNVLNENTISYSKVWGNHSLNLLGGATYQHETYEFFSASADRLSSDKLTYNNLATGDPLLARVTSNANEWTIISFLARANYSYKARYLFTVSARQDGSSRLSANNKWSFFPSGAFAWKVKEENFLKDVRWIDDLKLRVSYGKTGNQAVDVYSTLASLAVSNAYFNNGIQQTGIVMGNIGNDDLKWETTDQYDFGLDMGFLDSRLTANLDLYYKKTNDLLLTVQIPGTTGYETRLENVGVVGNKGIELNLNASLIRNQDLTWDLGFNIGHNKNKAVDLGRGLEYRELADGVRLIVGQPAPVFWGAVYDGIAKTEAQAAAAGVPIGFPIMRDVNGNGTYDGVADHAIIGNPQPVFFGGVNTNFRFKNLELDAFFQYSKGNDVINDFAPRLFLGEYASNVGAQAVDRWTVDNPEGNYPHVGSSTKYNVNPRAYSFAVQDGSFLRLKTLQLGYRFQSRQVSWLKNAKLYMTANNLFLITNYNWGYDPEVNSQGTSSVLRGMDGYNYPQNRSFLVGLNVNF